MYTNRKLYIVILMSILNFSAPFLLGQYAGGTGTAEDPFLIETAEQMNTIGLYREHWDKNFKLIADIDISAYTGEQYNIIGFLTKDNTTYFPFTGVFDGNRHTISNFTYSSEEINVNDVGIFGQVGEGSLICDLTLVDPNIDVHSPAGALVGVLAEGNIHNCSVLGGSISGNTAVGGLVGNNWVNSTESNIINCCSTATVSGNEWVGGLVGANFGQIKECFAAGAVSGNSDIGALVGWNAMLGGWPGEGEISDSYAAGSVSGNRNVGGLVGSGALNTTITKCYAAGGVSGNNYIGGLVGHNSGTITKSFWDIDSSGRTNSAGGTGKTSAEMKKRITFTSSGWDFLKVWKINEGEDYPKLSWEIENATAKSVDLNNDRIVDLQDFAIIAANWLNVYPVTHWKFDETCGAVASDYIVNNDGTIHGEANWQSEGAINGALQLDGVDDYVSTGFILNPAEGPFSVYIRVKGGMPGQVIISQADGANWLMADSSEGKLMTMIVGSNRNGSHIKSQTIITDNNWHCIGLVWDGSYRFLYIDGTEAARDNSTPGQLTSSDGIMQIGAGKGLEPNSYWSGMIDDFMIFDRVVKP
jgi:hypothetical protein